MEFGNDGKLNAALTTGIIGTAGVGLGLLGNLLGINNQPVNSESTPVSRYEASQSARIAELETEVKLRDANFYTVGEIGKLRDYVDRRFEGVNANINQQAVINAQVAANLSCMQQTIATLSGLTKTVIPITSICPEAMPRYNSWTAPTDTATGA